MKKAIALISLILFPLFGEIVVPQNFETIVEKLVYFKDDYFKVYYGGPVNSPDGCQWLMCASFEDQEERVTSVYEIVFIHCSPHSTNLKKASVYFSTVSDIDLRFKNENSVEYKKFRDVFRKSSSKAPCILVREVDVANVCFPKIFIARIHNEIKDANRQQVISFIRNKFKIKKKLVYLENKLSIQNEKIFQSDGLVEIKSIVKVIQDKKYEFVISHYYLEDQPWKSYYLICKQGVDLSDLHLKKLVPIRLDSGCTSGQLYHDDACDCLEQLDNALLQISGTEEEGGVVIHMPTQDGRGFGFAPKAETEIYKIGGQGRLRATPPLDTIQAAILLYNTDAIDIRTYEGCAKILADLGIRNIRILTDNKKKVAAMQNAGIEIIRESVATNKLSCEKHINAKKQYKNYYE